MKKKILFLVALWLLFGVAHSQTINSENSGALKIVPIGTPAPKGMVNVTLQVSANIPNGNGYMLLLDPTATTYGTVFPASGFLSYNCALAPGFMDAFAFKIPYNAEPICTTPNVVFDNSITIQITSGIYDYVIPNPLQQYGYWSIAPNPYGRQHNYEFEEGYHYTFVVDYNPAQSLELIITEDIPDTGTPSAVSDLTVTPDNTNDLQAVISWSNPTETSGGDPLTELTAIKVYQNFGATPIYTNSNPEIGGEESFTVTVPEQGSYVFMVVGENTVGVGTPTTAEVKFCSRISSFPYEEGFETSTGTSFPVCWDQEFVAGSKFWEVVPYHIGTPWTAQEGTQKARFSGAQGVKTKLITAPFDLSAVEHPVLNFWHTQRISFQYLDKLRIYYKNSAAGEWNFLVEYMTEVYDWTERYISLPNKSSEYYIAFEAEAQNAHGVQLDAVRVLEMVGLDGAAIKLFGVTTPMVNEPYVFKAQIMNVAGETLSGYSVKLVDDENNILDINEEGEDIVSMESKMISLRFTPTTTGPLSIRAIFELPEDVNPANDKSPFLNLNIQPQNQIFTSFVGGDNILRKTVPFNFDYGLSRVQSIYYDHEIIGRAGVITQLQYFSSFADNITGEFAEQLQIWMANTTADRLDTWLLPESEFTLVWDALVEIPFGQQTITLNLSNPFVYEGKNIVIMTNRPICNIMYNNDEFYTSETPEFVNRGREYHSMAYEFNWKYPGEAINYFPDIKMKFGLVGAKVTGKITSDGTTPLEGATVELIGPNADQYFNRTTDAEGNYSFDFLMDGSYQFKATKLGHSDATSTPLSVVAGSDYEVDLTLAPLSTFAMSGKVTANDLPNGVPNAEVKLSGYNTYSTIADETGNYSIPNIFANKTYNIETSKTGYVTYQSTVNIEDNNVTYNIMLNEIAWAVGRPLAEIVSENVEVTWVQPETFQEKTYVLDDGTAEEAYSFSTYDGAYGNMFVVGEEGEIISIDVFGVYHEYNMDRPINIDIYNENRELIGTSEYFVMKANEWVNVLVGNVPYSGTFYAMVHWIYSDDPMSTHHLGYDLTGPYATGNFDYFITAQKDWFCWHQMTWGEPGVFMIRPNANIYGKKVSYNVNGRIEPETPVSRTIELPEYSFSKKTVVAPECVRQKTGEQTRSFENYIVHRLTENQPESEWVLLNDNVAGTQYTDFEWEDLPSGIYRYAVRAKYTGDVVSDYRLTNKLKNKMEFDYQIKITTNSGDPVTGAIVRLTNLDGNPEHDYTKISGETGVSITDAWIGTYNLKITLSGHQAYTSTIAISEAGQSHTAELIEIIIVPSGLEIDVDCDEKESLFGWNKYQPFFDDMESHEDFIVDNIGDYILYSPNPGSVWGIGGASYPNKFEAPTFQVFNPYTTVPSLAYNPGILPHSGEKFLISFGLVLDYTDKWLILPKLRITDGEVFSFWAKTYSLEYPERIRVLVSTTGSNAPANFKMISAGSYIDLPEEWTYYSFDLSDYVREEIHLAINCVSVDGFFMMLDDIRVDIERGGSKSLTGYKVYLDGEEIVATTNNEFLFTDIGDKTYTAGVKAIYSSGESQMVTIQFMGCEEIGIGETNQMNLQLFPNPFTNEIQINHPDLINSVKIKDMMGQVVKNVVYNGKTITTENLSSGVYMVVIETLAGDKMIYKMVKN